MKFVYCITGIFLNVGCLSISQSLSSISCWKHVSSREISFQLTVQAQLVTEPERSLEKNFWRFRCSQGSYSKNSDLASNSYAFRPESRICSKNRFIPKEKTQRFCVSCNCVDILAWTQLKIATRQESLLPRWTISQVMGSRKVSLLSYYLKSYVQ
jgi:hypothetical protein